MACNNQFSVHHGGKNDVLQHSKNKQHLKNILTFSLDRQLITTTMKHLYDDKRNRMSTELIRAELQIRLLFITLYTSL
jgi:hypothetical protein